MSGGISNEDFVFKLSVVLLCLLSLLWIFVLFLFVWLRKIHQRVDRASKEWSVYSKLALDVTPNSPESEKTYWLPLVISNKRAVNSDSSESWKNINRTFAYAQEDHEGKRRSLEVNSAAQEEDEKTVDGSNSPGELLRADSEDTSDIKIVDDGPASLIIAGEQPEEKHGRRRVFMTLKSREENEKLCKESSPLQKECLVLVEANNLPYGSEKTPFRNKRVARQHLSEGNNLSVHAQAAEGSSKENPMPDHINENKKQSVSKVLYAVEKNGDGVMAEETLLSKDEQETPVGTSGQSESEMVPRHGDESQDLMPTENGPKEKGEHKQKKRTRRPRSKGNRKSSGERLIRRMDKLGEDKHGYLTAQHVGDKIADGERKNVAAELQETSKEHFEQGGHKEVLVKRVELSLNQSEESGVLIHGDGEEDNYECITTPDNTPHEKFADEEPGTKEADVLNTSEEIYSNIDDNISGLRTMSAAAYPGAIHVNSEHLDMEYPDDSSFYANADEARRESVMFNDNPAFDNADEGPIYVNLREMIDI